MNSTIESQYTDTHHRTKSGTVEVIVRNKLGSDDYTIMNINVVLRDRSPNVPNAVLYNIERAISDLELIKNDIETNVLYLNRNY